MIGYKIIVGFCGIGILNLILQTSLNKLKKRKEIIRTKAVKNTDKSNQIIIDCEWRMV